MKTPSLLTAGFALSAASALAATSAIPERRPADRYDKMPQDWPFSLATPVVAAAEPAKGWASDLFVTSIAKETVDGGEKYFVGIKDRLAQNPFSLSGSEPGYDGISIGGVQWSESLEKIVVTLKKGNEFGTVKFDEQLWKSPGVGAAMPRPPGGLPGAIPNFPNANAPRNVVRPAVPGVPRPANIPAVLPQNAPGMKIGPSNTNSGNATTSSTPPDTKHRVRVIKSSPSQ